MLVLDSLVISSVESLSRVSSITNCEPLSFKDDIRNKDPLVSFSKKTDVKAVGHFACLKAVSDCVSNPINYYFVNVTGTV